MIFTAGIILFIAAWIAIQIVYRPIYHAGSLLELVVASCLILGIILMLASVGILAWNYLP